MMISPPLFSVILVAHDRKKYLMGALTSLSVQTLPREMFEVIIVKNFEDRTIDAYSAGIGFKSILTNALTVGAKMSIGVRNSIGKFVVFLEDDDLFKPEKLALISEFIQKSPDETFFHNSIDVIDSTGKLLRNRSSKQEIAKFVPNSNFVKICLKNGIAPTDLGYSSCITIRRDIITQDVETLEHIKAAPDFFLILSFISSGTRGILIPDRLTSYRLHESQSNRTGQLEDFRKGNIEVRQRWVDDYYLMKNHFTDGIACEISSFFFDYNELFVLALIPKRSIVGKCIRFAKLLKAFNIFRLYRGWLLILLAIIGMISPVMAQRSYYAFRKSRYFGDQVESL